MLDAEPRTTRERAGKTRAARAEPPFASDSLIGRLGAAARAVFVRPL
ncbi:hypothetical protein [Streptomyces sp. NPDC090445]